jgi:hypothetical protein
MIFYDRKEEVLEIKLTPYGRYLLSLGELEPVYYSFFDDDILYDKKHLIGKEENITYELEDQNETEGRIKETPRIHCQTVFSERKAAQSTYIHDERYLQDHFEREYSLNSELGTADYYSDFSPSWDINFLKGSLTGSVDIPNSTYNYTGSGPNIRIPQLRASASVYQPIVGDIDPDSNQPILLYDEDLREITEFDDNTFLEIRKDFFLLEINENNAVFQKENFEIELFEVSTISDPASELGTPDIKEALKPLRFAGASTTEIDQAGYFFNINVDEQISELDLCKYKGVDTTKGLFLQNTFDCNLASTEGGMSIDQYATMVDPEDICD